MRVSSRRKLPKTNTMMTAAAVMTLAVPAGPWATPSEPVRLEVNGVSRRLFVAGNRPGRVRPEDLTLFCSVGLAGTEVVVADRLLGAFA